MRGFAKGRYQRLYQLLEVSEAAGEAEIKAAYLRLAKEYHPDSTSLQDKKAAAEVFSQLTEARDVLLSTISKDLSEPAAAPKDPKSQRDMWEMYRNVQTGKAKPAYREEDEAAVRQEYRRELKKTLFGVAIGVGIWLYLSLRHSFVRKRVVDIGSAFEVKEEGNRVVLQLKERSSHSEYEQVAVSKDIWRCRTCQALLQRAYIPQHSRLSK